MKASDTAYNLIKRWEGCKLSSYSCPSGVCTIGFGHTKNVKPNQNISIETALEYLREDVELVESALAKLIKVELTQNQYDALVSFVFNIGAGAFAVSTCLARINNGEFEKVPAEIKRWKYARGKVLLGLEKRRNEEAELWNTEKNA